MDPTWAYVGEEYDRRDWHFADFVGLCANIREISLKQPLHSFVGGKTESMDCVRMLFGG